MTTQITGIPPIYKLNNHNGLNHLTSLLSIEDRANLRACCKTFKSEVPDIPQEAKTFLVFEAKLPLFRALNRKIEIYRYDTIWWTGFHQGMKAYMLKPFHMLSILGGPAIALLGGESVEKVSLLSIPLIGSITLLGTISLVRLCSREIKLYELRKLWQEYQNQTAPRDVIEQRHNLIERLRNHETLSARYTEAGGMDQVYHTAGLDHAIAEMRDRRG
jgi:hypothetical protein